MIRIIVRVEDFPKWCTEVDCPKEIAYSVLVKICDAYPTMYTDLDAYDDKCFITVDKYK